MIARVRLRFACWGLFYACAIFDMYTRRYLVQCNSKFTSTISHCPPFVPFTSRSLSFNVAEAVFDIYNIHALVAQRVATSVQGLSAAAAAAAAALTAANALASTTPAPYLPSAVLSVSASAASSSTATNSTNSNSSSTSSASSSFASSSLIYQPTLGVSIVWPGGALVAPTFRVISIGAIGDQGNLQSRNYQVSSSSRERERVFV